MQPKTLTISSVGQITLPRSVRKVLGLEPGAKLDVEINQEKKTITLRKQKTIDEVIASLEELNKEFPTPKPDPKWSKMSVGEMALENIKSIKGDTWV